MSATDSFSTTEALKLGWDKTFANLKPLLILGAAGAFLSLVNGELSRAGGLGGLLALGVQLVHAGVAMLLVRACIDVHDGAPVKLDRWTDQWPRYFPWLLINVALAVIIGFGTLLLVVPGVLWALQFGFAAMLTLDKNLDPLGALRESSRVTRGRRGPLFVFVLACIGANVLGLIALGIGLLVTIPTTLIAAVHFLRALQQRAGADLPSTPMPSMPASQGA
jgi:uncharacterized membrane protein